MHLVITDSGLGGLTICAGLERALRQRAECGDVRLTYVNAWPEEGRGYNAFPDVPARVEVFDRALRAMTRMAPDRILIACNTLSILYPLTEHHRTRTVPVQGIIEAGLAVFSEALDADPSGTIVLLGTRTTIESDVHRQGLLRRGVAARRIASASCHGLATAIEGGPLSPAAGEMIEACAERASETLSNDGPLFVGLCCTHYGMVGDRLAGAIARRTGRAVRALDPNERLVRDALPGLERSTGRPGRIVVEMISKVTLSDTRREAVAEVVDPVSPATAAALRTCTHEPDLF